jgi:hypothetical protein
MSMFNESDALQMKKLSLRLELLAEKGVDLVDPRQIFIDDEVQLDRIFPGSVLFPGTRLLGYGTVVAPGAKLGSEGPATVVNSIVGEGAEIASGFVTDSVLLSKARIGSAGHIRGGTLLEEEASTAHAVGLKHTILTSFVTLGSLVNCCDCFISGGRSRSNHTEIGSGFIHFNFTPWGEAGDKATPSLIGDVPQGVFLRQERIFIGGNSGMVGPNRIGYGTFTVAGQVIRSDVGARRIHAETLRGIDTPWTFEARGLSGPRVERNLEYVGQLAALRAWYVAVRKARLTGEQRQSHLGMTMDAAIHLIDSSMSERWFRLAQFLGVSTLPAMQLPSIACPLAIEPSSMSHVEWLRTLSDDAVNTGTDWLQTIVQEFVGDNQIRT